MKENLGQRTATVENRPTPQARRKLDASRAKNGACKSEKQFGVRPWTVGDWIRCRYGRRDHSPFALFFKRLASFSISSVRLYIETERTPDGGVLCTSS